MRSARWSGHDCCTRPMGRPVPRRCAVSFTVTTLRCPPRGGDAVDAGVVGVEEAMADRQAQHVRQVGVDHTAMARNGDPLTRVIVDHAIERGDHACGELVGGLVVSGPLAAHHRLPAGVVGGLQLLDRYVLAGVAVPLGDAVDHRDVEAPRRGERLGGLVRPSQRAGVHGIDRLCSQVVGEVAGLRVPRLGELRIGDALAELSSYW